MYVSELDGLQKNIQATFNSDTLYYDQYKNRNQTLNTGCKHINGGL